MKNTRIAKVAVEVAVFYCTLLGFCQSIHAQSEIKLRLVHDTVAIISLTANDQGPFDFVLDTGTNTTIVDPSIARRLSLVAMDRIQLSTIAGTQIVIRSSMRTLAAGSAHVENVEVLVQDLPELRHVDSHIQGIVGQNFLSHFNYLLDYRKHSVQFEQSTEIRDAIEGQSVPVEVMEDKMLVTSEMRSSGQAKLRLLLDSGANVLTLIRKPSHGVDTAARSSWLELTASGQAGMQVGHIRELTVGSEKLHDLTVGLPDVQAADAERVEDGVLPTALFNAVYFNNSGGFVVFNPKLEKN